MSTKPTASGASAHAGARPPGLQRGSSQLRRLELAMLFAGLAAFGLLYCTQPVLPALGVDFQLTPATASLTVSLGTGMLAVLVIPASSLAERFGRDRLMRTGLAVAAALTLASAVVGTFWLLLLLRALVGAALAAVVAVAMGHLGDEVHPGHLGGAMGLYVAGNTLGGVGGRLASAGVADLGGWRLAIGVVGILAAVCTAAFVVLLPKPQRFVPRPLQVGAQWSVLRSHLADPGVRRLCLVAFTLMGGFVATYNYLSYRLLSAPISLPHALVGLVFLAYLAGTVTSSVAGRLADRLGRKPVMLGSFVVIFCGLALMLPSQLWLVVAGLVVFTGGFFGVHAVASGWIPLRVGQARAQASALYLLAYYAGSSVLGSVAGLAYGRGGWSATTVVVAGLILIALVATLSMPTPRRQQATEGSAA